jgi:hypothetical protein
MGPAEHAFGEDPEAAAQEEIVELDQPYDALYVIGTCVSIHPAPDDVIKSITMQVADDLNHGRSGSRESLSGGDGATARGRKESVADSHYIIRGKGVPRLSGNVMGMNPISLLASRGSI